MKKYKWWIVSFVVIMVVALAIFVAESYLKTRIKRELQIQTASGDTLRISKVDLGLLGGWLDINDLIIRWNVPEADTSLQSLTYLIRGGIGKVRLKGLSYSEYLFNNRITVDELLIDSSTLDLHLIERPFDANIVTEDAGQTEDNTLAIHIAGMKLAPSRIRYFGRGDTHPLLEVQAISLKLGEFSYPQPSDTASLVEHINWHIDSLHYSRSETSDLLVATASGNSKDSSLSFRRLAFIPKMSKPEYSNRLQQQDSRVEVNVSSGSIQGLDWRQLLTHGTFRSRTLKLDSCHIDIYEDSRLPVDTARYKSLYQEKLLKAAIGITVDTTWVHNSSIRYEIRPDEPEPKLGFLEFPDLNAVLTNITNDHERIADQPLLHAEIHTQVNGESDLHAFFTFDLSSVDYKYSFAGNMQGFDLPQFNTILAETAKMKIVQGRMQRLAFKANADKYRSRGEMRIEYDNLKIAWQENHNILAALGQKILMREENPRNGNYRVGQIYYVRQPYRSFWNFYLKSLLSGLNSTAMPNLFLPKELDAKKEIE